jgi:uncharacterized repeat protein (TIGR02543 family)
MSKKKAAYGSSITRVLIVSLFIGLTAAIAASATPSGSFAILDSVREFLGLGGPEVSVLKKQPGESASVLDNDTRGAKPTASPTVESYTVGKDNSVPTNEAVNLYPVTRATAITFNSISGTGTSVGSWRNAASLDDNLSNSLPIGFSFTYNGGVYQNFRLSTNGFMTFNTTSAAVGNNSAATGPYGYENPSLSAVSSAINFSPTVLAPMWDDLTVPAAGTLNGNIKYLTTGSSPNRILTVEWIGMEVFNNAGPDLNFQVKLYEVDGHIEYIYGTMTASTATYSYSTGINAQTLTTPTAAELLTQTTANTATFSNTASNSLATVPATNTRLTFTPPTTVPSAATNLTFPTVTRTSAALNWTDNANNEINYNVLISTDSGATYQTFGAIFPADTSGATITGLAAGTTYFFRILPCTEAVCSAPHDASVTTNPLISGTKTIGPGGDYTTFGAAIADVNSGVGTGGVTFNVTAGTTFVETIPCLTVQGTAGNPIVFQRSGAGANPIIQTTGGAGTFDAGVCILGGDFITFDGIDVTASGAAVEYGYIVNNLTATNGAQNNTVKNTKVTLNRTLTTSIGIVQSDVAAEGGVTPTSAAGANSTNKYYNITVENAYKGIWLEGNASFPDLACEIGVTGGGTTTIGSATANDIGNGTIQPWGIRASSQSGVKIFNTEVRNVGGSAIATNGILVELLQGTNDVYNNKVHDIRALSTSSTTGIAGISAGHAATGTVVVRIYNNFVYGITSAYTGAASATRQIKGILTGTGGTTSQEYQVDNNSVRLDGSSSPNISSVCFAVGTASGPVIKTRNNIFANVTGTQTTPAKHIAWESTSAAVFGPAGSVSDFNELYIPTATQGFIGLGNATDFATLANWQAMNGATAGPDDASITTDPKFFTATDLHIIGTSPAIDTIGTTIATYTTDIDGQTRPTGTKYDVGADEYVAAAGSLQLSSSTYSGNEGTTSTVTVTRSGGDLGTVGATYTLTDGTATGGAACTAGVDYVNPGPQPVSLGTNVTSTTFGIALCTDAVLEGPQAFTITLSLPTGGSTLGSPTSATATIGDITPAFNGSYNVGTGEILTSLTNTGGIFDLINTTGATGNITINITSNLTSETGAVALNQIAGGFTVLIKPSGAPRTISGALSSNALVRLNGADGVTIDGSTSGGTDRSLTITNTATTAPSGVSLISLGTGLGATSNTVKNCNISTGVATSIGYGIAVGGTLPGSTGADNDTTTIQNNSITVAPVGIYAAGTASFSTGGNNSLAITGNTVDYNGTLGGIGIQVGNATGASVSQNTVSEQTTATQSPTAISLETGFVSSSVTSNLITKSLTTNTGGYGGRGITVGTGTATSALTIANNMVYGVNGSDFSGFSNSSSMGIAIGMIGNSATITTTAGGINLYFNSVRMTGNIGSNSTSAITTALYVGSGASALDVRNNIFANTMVGVSTTQKNYGIYSAVIKTAYTTIDNNDYFVSNTFNAASAIPGFIGVDQTTLAAIQNTTTGFGQNVSSKIADPNFTSTTNLHIKNGSGDTISPVARAGVTISGITTDFEGDTRKATPDIGADEFNTYLLTVGTTAGGTITAPALSPVIVNSGAATTITATANAGFTFTGWTVLTGSATFGNAALLSTTATLSSDASVQANFTPTTYQLSVVADTGGTITAPASSPVTVNHGAATTITAAANAGYTFANWTVTSGSGSIASASSASTTITLTSGNATVQANFTINTYTITATAGANGAISPSGAVSVNHGANQMFTISPNAGYHTVDVLVDGISQGVIPTYTFTNVTANHTIDATFAIDATPTILTSGGPLSFANTPAGGVSAEQSYTVEGTSLTANLVVTSPSPDFEVSTTPGSGFGSSVSLTPVSGTVATTTIYVRFTPGSSGLKSGNITNASTGATTQNVAVSGTGTAGGYYRSKQSGNWSDASTWEVSSDNATWGDTTLTPTAANSDGITVMGSHTVTVVSNTDADQATVASGGTLAVSAMLTVADGTGTDLANNGTVTVNGTFALAGTVSGTAFSYGGSSTLAYAGTTAQTSTSVEYPLIGSTPTSLTINNAGGVTLHSNRSVAGTFTLTNGVLITDAAKILTVTNTAAGAVVGGSAISYVNGPLRRVLPDSLTGSSVYAFPVGKSGYNALELVDPHTTAALTPTMQVEVHDVHPGGFGATGIENLRDRYWSAEVPVGGFADTQVRLTDSSLTNGVDQVGFNGDLAPAGNYLAKGGTVVGDTIESTTATPPPGFYAIGGPGPKIEADPFPLNFGNQVVSTASSQQNLTITNTGSSNLTITAASITGTNQSDFAVTSGPGSYPVVLTPGNSTIYGITFTPSALNTRNAALRLTSNAENGATYDAELTGNGIPVPTYTITASSGGNGTVTPAGVTTVNSGDSQAYSITPSAGYHIVDVLVDTVSQGAIGSFTFNNVTANHTISATFAINTYTITATAGAGGSIAPSGVTTVNYDASQAYTITPNANYHILDVLVDGISIGAAANYTFSNVTANRTIDATFAVDTHTVTYSNNGGTGAQSDPSSPYNSGSLVTVLGAGSTARTGYTFANWNTAANGSGTSYNPADTFTISANTTLYAQWTINQYSLFYNGNGNTGGTAPATQTADFGSSVTVSGAGSLVKTGYTFSGWNTASDGTGTTYLAGSSFTIPAQNTTLYAQWTVNQYTVTYDANGGTGSQTDPNSPYNFGSTVTVLGTGSITRTGYTFANWNTAADGSGTSYNPAATFTIGAANMVLYAQWTINTYTITATAGANGIISPSGAVSVNHGDNQTFTITPNAGYHVDVLTVDGGSVPAATSYTFTNVTAAHTIHATFAINTYTITATAGANGSISPNGAVSVNHGANQTFTITPNAGHHVDVLTADGGSVPAATSYTFTNVTATHTIDVTFAANTTPTITFDAAPTPTYLGGDFTVNATTTNSDSPALTYSVVSGPCALVSGATFSSTGAGTCQVQASGAATTNYNAATAAQNVTIAKANQAAVTLSGVPSTATYGDTFTAVGGGGSGTGAFSYAVTGTACTVHPSTGAGSVVAISGGCSVTATRAGDTNYNPATSAASVITTINPANQATLTVDDPGTVAYGSTPQLTTTGGSGTGAVTFSDGGSTGCSVTGSGVLTVVDASAACSVTATKAADANYNATTSAQRTITLAKANQAALTAVATPSSVTYGSTSALSSTGGNGTGAVTFSSGASTGCSVTGTTLSVINASGTCEVTATKAADNNYNAASSAPLTVTLVKATPTVTFGAAPTPTYLGGNFTVSASTTNTDSPALTYSVVSGPCAPVSGATFSSTGAGTCQVQASGAATANFTTASATQNVTIAKATPTVIFGAAPTPGYPGADFTVSASTTSTDSSTLTYSKVSGPCTFVSGATFTSTGAGTCIVRADGAASTNFNAAFDTQNVTIAAVQYTIDASAGPNGSITPSGAVVVNSGANQAFTIAADAGYHIADVLVDSVSQGTTGSYTFTNVTANHTISATFAINTYTIAASAGANGSITPNGSVTVNHGANQTFTITPDGGYNVANVLVDGVSVGAVTSHTFTNVTANHTIAATFFSGTQALIVYVDDNWAGTTLGTDPDGGGPASSFGYDAFATIQDGVAGVAVNGTVIVNPGSYSGDINVNRAIDVRGVFTTTGAITVTAPGASVSPGASPGIINSGNLSLTAGSTVNIEVNGPIVGTQYDQLNVTGTVTLGSANLNVMVSNAYTPTPGQTFTIVNNDGNDPVTGTFAGLAENDVFYSGTTSFRISYAGGSNNNDVVLTTVALCNSVSIPNYTTLNGNQVTASINVDNTTGNALQSTDFTITYNPAVVTFSSAILGTVTAGGVLNMNSSTPGTLVVSIFKATPFSGAGSMLDITFNTVGQPGTSTPVAFNAFKFNEGTQCISTSNGLVSVISGTITGTVTYGNSIPAATHHVPNTTINAAGPVNASVLTNLAGAYSISSLGAGSYTVTPSKSGEVNGAVSGMDSAQIAQWVVGLISLNATQQAVADVSGTGGVSSFDSALIARYVVSLPNAGSSGTWRFAPASTTYANVNVNRTGDYTALLMGDVSGNWIDPLATRPAPDAEELKPVAIGAPELSALVNTEVTVPVEISDTTNKGILAYQFELRYDPAVLEPAANPADLTDTISTGYQVTVNAAERGLLRVVVFGTQPLSGAGRLINLRFNAIGNPGSASDLIWESLGLNEGGFDVRSTNGRVQVTASPSNNASLGGRVISAEGQPIRNARVTLTDTTGQSRIAITGSLGYYQFTGLQLGETYTVRTSAKRHRFQPVTVSVSGEAVNLDIIAQPGG